MQKHVACLIDRFTNKICTNFTCSSQNVTTHQEIYKWRLHLYMYNDILSYAWTIHIQFFLWGWGGGVNCLNHYHLVQLNMSVYCL